MSVKPNEKTLFRDIQVANDVAVMAELGYFDVEFIMYGCAYLNPVDSKMYYKVSSQESDIYDFIEKSTRDNIYPGKMVSLRKRCPVPSGMKEDVAEEVKLELAYILKEIFPKDFFRELYQIAEEHKANTAAEILWNLAEHLEGMFDEEKLHQFEELVHYYYSCNELTTTVYRELCVWLEDEYKNLLEEEIRKDVFKKTVYGILYEKDGKRGYIADAQRINVYRKICELEEDGAFVSPIYSKICWYNRKIPITDAINSFKDELKDKLSSGEISALKDICKHITIKEKEEYKKKIENIRERFGNAPAETAIRYGYHWRILMN